MGRKKKVVIKIEKEFDAMEQKKNAGRIPTPKPGKIHGSKKRDYNRKKEKNVGDEE